MVNSVQGFLLPNANNDEFLQDVFVQFSTSSDRQPLRFIISKEESDCLPICKSVFDVSSVDFTATKNQYKESLIYSIMFDQIKFFGSGYYMCNNKLFLNPLTNTLIKVNELTGKGFYQKCDFINTSSQIDSRVAANAIKDAEISLNSSRIHILPFGRRSFNFGHWHLNTLSSIYLALKHVPDAIVVLPMLNKWQKESLVSLGLYDKNKIIEIPLLESCIVPNAMFFSTTFTWHGIPNVKPMISMFKDACFFSNPPEGVSEKWPTPPSKIYLSRKSDPSHKLVNEQLVEEEFASRGFVILEPQSISYHELAYLLAHVDILAGQSGAALIRAGICRPGTIFIQLCYEGFTDYIYHKVAALSGFSKSYLYVEPEQSIIVDREAGKASHFHKISGWSINVKNFKAFMKSIF